MVDVRTEINKAFDALVTWQEAKKFQAIAYHIAKNYYPELASPEYWKDEGQDAYIMAYTRTDDLKIALSCSLSGTIKKIRDDCKRIQNCTNIDFLVFVTISIVTTVDISKWKEKIKKEFGYELIVMPRSSLLAELERPENIWICEEILGLNFPARFDIRVVENDVKGIASKHFEGWSADYNYNSKFQIELSLKTKSRDNGKPAYISVSEICNMLKEKTQIILKGAPGSGKSITLLQVAERLLLNSENPIPILISLPSWAITPKDLLTYLYDSFKIPLEYLDQLFKANRLVVLFNGWNEIPVDCIEKISFYIKDFIRIYPDISVIITTRESKIEPPFTNNQTYYIDSLTNDERSEIIKRLRPVDHEKIIKLVSGSLSLNEITATPLFLTGLIQVFNKNVDLPTTRYEILNALVVDSEKEHMASLSISTGHNYRKYLLQIAADMTLKGAINVNESDILKSIAICSKHLLDDNLIGVIPNANEILMNLYDHHIIVKTQSQPISVKFIHQQFQEWFASEYLYFQILNVFELQNNEKVFDFCKEIINKPIWEEALIFLVEHLNRDGQFDICADLVRLVMKVDLTFSAELAGYVNNETWAKINNELVPILIQWHNKPSQYAKDCALRAMLITDKPEFSNIIEPLVCNPDQQIRLNILGKQNPFPVESLGVDWQDKFNKWSDDVRHDFISEMFWGINPSYLPFIEQIAKNDPCNSVRIAAIMALYENGSLDIVRNIFKNDLHLFYEDEVYTQLLRYTSPSFITEFASNIKNALKCIKSQNARYVILDKLTEINYSEVTELIKEELQLVYSNDLYFKFIPVLYKASPLWIKDFIIAKMVDGELWGIKWVNYLYDITITDFIKIIPSVFNSSEENLNDRLSILIKTKNSIISRELIKILLNESTIIVINDEQQFILSRSLLELPIVDRIDIILKYKHLNSVDKIKKLVNISTSFPVDKIDLRSMLSLEIINSLKETIYKWYHMLENYPPERATITYLLGQIGSVEDIPIIEKWIANEKNRKILSRIKWERRTKEFQAVGGEVPLMDGVCYSNIYAAALAKIDDDLVTSKFISYLDDPEYIAYASSYLVDIVYKERGYVLDRFEFGNDYSNIVEEREKNNSVLKVKTIDCEYSKNIRMAIIKIVDESKSQGKEPQYSYNVFNALYQLSFIDNEEILPIINELACYEYSIWDIARSLKVLELRGFMISGGFVYKLLSPTIDKYLANIYSGENSLLHICIEVLLLSDMPNYGINVLEKLYEKKKYYGYEFMNIIKLIRYCKSDEAVLYLVELGNDINFIKDFFNEWITTISLASEEKTKEIIISYLTSINDNTLLIEIVTNKFLEYDSKIISVALKLACKSDDFMENLMDFCKKASTLKEKNIAIHILREIGTEEAAILALKLLDKMELAEFGFYLENLIETVVVRRVKADTPNSYCQLPKSAQNFRKELIRIVLDNDINKQSALLVLTYIEALRIEYGRPMDEPRNPDIEKLYKAEITWPLL